VKNLYRVFLSKENGSEENGIKNVDVGKRKSFKKRVLEFDREKAMTN